MIETTFLWRVTDCYVFSEPVMSGSAERRSESDDA